MRNLLTCWLRCAQILESSQTLLTVLKRETVTCVCLRVDSALPPHASRMRNQRHAPCADARCRTTQADQEAAAVVGARRERGGSGAQRSRVGAAPQGH